MDIPIIAITPETAREIVKNNHKDRPDECARLARVYAILFGTRAYNAGDIDHNAYDEWVALALTDTDEANISACLG